MKPITIVGGGLAGLTLGLALRRRNVPVEIVEAGRYPRHRVCGEFINGRGLQVLESLGLTDRLRAAGSRTATTAILIPPKHAASSIQALPQRALCLSRHALDASLAQCAIEAGARLTEGQRWSESFSQPGVVRATGRRVPAGGHDIRWFGVKGHAHGLPLHADLEMHFGARGYVGLCRVEGDRVNVCGLVREPSRPHDHDHHDTAEVESPARGHLRILQRVAEDTTSDLAERLARADWDFDSLCAVAGLPIHIGLPPRHTSTQPPECAIGDAAVMIPPVTGNGMSMAFESAAAAADILVGYATGSATWESASRRVGERQRELFRRRLVWANLLHRCLFTDFLSRPLFALAAGSPWLWRMIFATTRA